MNNLLASLKETVQEAWVTLAALPDPDAHFRRGLGFGWVFQTFDRRDYPDDRTRCREVPSPEQITEAEVVFEWLAWLRRQRPPEGGKVAIERIGTWALGTPTWRMAQRERCSGKTIHNRIDRSVAKILNEFVAETIAEAVEVSPLNEPEQPRDQIRGFGDKSVGNSPDTLEPGRIYVTGIGMMFRGRRYRSAID